MDPHGGVAAMTAEEEEALERSRAERVAILERYARGRDPRTQIDDWEEPSLEIYHTQDRYGFIQ